MSGTVNPLSEGLVAWGSLEKTMTEAEWLAGEDSVAMLRHVRDKISGRRLRLFAAACCRRIWPLLADARSRAAVEVAERYADGLVTNAARDAARAAAWDAARAAAWAAARDAARAGAWAGAWAAAWDDARDAAWAAARDAARAGAWAAAWDDARDAAWAAAWAAARDAERKTQVALLRDLVGNPWRPVTLSPGWLTPDVLSLAGAAYAERLDDFTLDPARLAVLSDALEEAGCVGVCPVCDGKRRVKVWDKPPDIETWHKCGYEMPRGCGGSGFATHPLLAALRSPGPHYRGFWAVDLILNRA